MDPAKSLPQGDSAAAATATQVGHATPSGLSAFSTPGQETANQRLPQASNAMPHAVLAGNIQSIETKIAFKAMQRIAALFHHAQPSSDSPPVPSQDPAVVAPASAFAVLPSPSGSAFVPLLASATQQPLPQSAPAHGEPTAHTAKPGAGAATPPSDGAFCGDSDVVGDMKVCTW